VPTRNSNGTEVYYMTSSEEKVLQQRQEQLPVTERSPLLYEIDAFIQEKLVPKIASKDDENLYVPSMVVGTLTAAVGFLYVNVLSRTRSLLWNSLPRKLFASGNASSLSAALFLISMTTLGGVLLGYLSTKASSTYSASEFVSICSKFRSPTESSENDSDQPLIPSARDNLLPLISMCLVTSSFGIPLGPEAPMVGVGTLIGAAVARYLYQSTANESRHRRREKEEILAYAGASGALTGAMGIPIAGTIFALEMTQSDSGMSAATHKALSPAVAASLVAICVLKLLVTPSSIIGGHFDYFAGAAKGGLDHAITGQAMILTAVASGLGGALIGTAFHKLYAALKLKLWTPPMEPPSITNGDQPQPGKITKRRKIAVRACIGLAIGLIGALYPQSLFWGEGSLQSYVDGQQTPFANTHHGLPSFLYKAAQVDPSMQYATPWSALQVGVAKFMAIVLAGAGKFSGGIVFPLFAAAPAFAHAFAPLLYTFQGGSRLLPIAVMCTMAATQASATRTPLASVLILALTASASTELSVIVPACLISSYLSIFASKWLSKKSYFHYSKET
jgi:H+/Cl- antiporter ClcA